MESNHPSGGLPRPAGFEDRMGHQTPAAPAPRLRESHWNRIESTEVHGNKTSRCCGPVLQAPARARRRRARA